jgi:opacity protein-like surface antigen
MHFLQRNDFTEQYNGWSQLDVEKAKSQLRSFLDEQKYESVDNEASIDEFTTDTPNLKISWLKWVVAIAAVAILAIIIIKPSETVKPVEMSQVMTDQIQKVENSSYSGATVTLSHQSISVRNDSVFQLVAKANTSASDDEPLTLQTVSGKEFWVTLPDGSRVHLNYNTKLRYPLKFKGDTRRVYLEGEAYFYVAHSDKSFVVETPQGYVRDYGTEFNVRTNKKVHSLQVILVNGSVGVGAPGNKDTKMAPGEMALLDDHMNEPSVSKVDIAPYISWNKGNFYFNDCTLEMLMGVIGHWYDKEVVFINENDKAKRFTGNLDKYNSIAPILNAISMATGLSISLKNEQIIVK